MESTEKRYKILKNDYKDIRGADGLPVRLYRILALRPFTVQNRSIEAGDLGGFVQYETNLPQDSTAWVFHTAKVFGNAVVKDDSIVTEDAHVFGDAVVEHGSHIGEHAHVYQKAVVRGSKVRGKVDVRGTARLEGCQISNACKVFGNARLTNCMLVDGALACDHAVAADCKLYDVSQICGEAVLGNCVLRGRAVVNKGQHKNSTFSENIDLQVITGD
jgi:carbonic anhydrase/acetyltransferase-like protein (isoleucine patch superfamily)